MKRLLLTVVLACMACHAQIDSNPYYERPPTPSFTIPVALVHIPREDCISIVVKPLPLAGVSSIRSVEVVATNGCAVKLLLARISLKYFDRNGFRIGSDSDAGAITIPSFAVAEKIKQTIALPKDAVRAEVRDVLAVK